MCVSEGKLKDAPGSRLLLDIIKCTSQIYTDKRDDSSGGKLITLDLGGCIVRVYVYIYMCVCIISAVSRL